MLDSEKLYKSLIESPELKGIPTIYIVRVSVTLLKIIEKGKVFKNIWN